MGRRGKACVLALLGVASAAPWASASSVEGSMIVESGATFPEGSGLVLPSAIALLGSTGPDTALLLEASRVQVHVHEKRYLDALGLARAQGGYAVESSWMLTDATVTADAAGDAAGFAAFEASGGGAPAFVPSGRAALHHRASTVLANNDDMHLSRDPQDRRHAFYWRHVTGDHVHVEAPGVLEGRVSGVLRVQGPDLVLRGRENATTLETGEWSPRAGEVVVRWAYLSFQDATLRLASDAPVEVVAPEASQVAWRGAAHVRVVDGALRTEAAEYASIGPVALAGDLRASLFPVADGGTNLRLAAIRGDLASTTLAEHPRPAPAPVRGDGPGAGWLAVAAVLGAAAAAGGAWGGQAARRLRVRLRPPSREEQHAWCLGWAAWFEEQEDPAAALECLGFARQYVDEADHDLLLWEASCLDRLGNLEEALAAFEAAVAVAPRGECEAAFSAAILAGQLAREAPALLNLRLALMGDPFLVEVVDALASSEDDPFEALRGQPAFRQLLREARGWARTAGSR